MRRARPASGAARHKRQSPHRRPCASLHVSQCCLARDGRCLVMQRGKCLGPHLPCCDPALCIMAAGVPTIARRAWVNGNHPGASISARPAGGRQRVIKMVSTRMPALPIDACSRGLRSRCGMPRQSGAVEIHESATEITLHPFRSQFPASGCGPQLLTFTLIAGRFAAACNAALECMHQRILVQQGRCSPNAGGPLRDTFREFAQLHLPPPLRRQHIVELQPPAARQRTSHQKTRAAQRQRSIL